MPFLADNEDEARIVRAHLDTDFANGVFTIYNGWLCVICQHCTCAGGGPEVGFHHEDGCGFEPMVDLVEVDGPRAGRHAAPPADPPYPGVCSNGPG